MFHAHTEPLLFRLQGWKLAHCDTREVCFRPRLLSRVAASAVLALVLAGGYAYIAHESGRFDPSRPSTQTALGVLIGVALLPALSCLWSRIRLRHDLRGNLELFSWILVPRTRSLPLNSYAKLQFGAEEQRHKPRRSPVEVIRWRWVVVLAAKQDENGMCRVRPLMFHLRDQKDRPREGGRPPEIVGALAEWLRTQGGFPAEGPRIRPMEGGRMGGWTLSSGTGPVSMGHTERTYHSLEEMPPELRQRVEGMMAQGAGVHREQRFICRGNDGIEREYASLDEMPPEVRAFFERHYRN